MQNVNFIPELSPDTIFPEPIYVQSDLIKKTDRPDGIYRDGFPRHHAPLVILENKIKRILLRTKNKQRYLPEWFGQSFSKVAFRSLSIYLNIFTFKILFIGIKNLEIFGNRKNKSFFGKILTLLWIEEVFFLLSWTSLTLL